MAVLSAFLKPDYMRLCMHAIGCFLKSLYVMVSYGSARLLFYQKCSVFEKLKKNFFNLFCHSIWVIFTRLSFNIQFYAIFYQNLPTTFQDVKYNPTQSSINHDHPHSRTNVMHLSSIYFVFTAFSLMQNLQV